MGLERQLMHRLFTWLMKWVKTLLLLGLAFFAAIPAAILFMVSVLFLFLVVWASETLFEVRGEDQCLPPVR
jgi:hypothetical protein